MPKHLVRLALSTMLGAALLALLPSTVSAQVARIEGNATDEAGNPLEGVEVRLKRVDTNALMQPAKTNKKGNYLYMVEPGFYILIASKPGYLTVRQVSDLVNPDGVRTTLTFFFDDKQEFSKQLHVYATGDLTSKAKSKIDWVLTTPDKHTATVNKLYSEYRGVPAEGESQPGEPGKPAAPAATPSEAKSPYESAQDLMARKDFAGAIPLLKQAVEKTPDDPNNADAYYQLGKASFETESLAEAEAALKKAKALDPTKPGVSFYLARMYDKKGRKIQAVQALEEERNLSPDSEAVLDSLAGLYADTSQPDKAIEIYEARIEKNPDDFGAYTSLAGLYKEKGDTAKEEEIYKKMGDRDPTGKSLYNLGTIAFNRNEPDKARVYYERVLAKDPNHAMAHFQMAYTLINLGNFSQAIGHFETFLKLSPKDAKAAEAKKMVDELKKLDSGPAKASNKG